MRPSSCFSCALLACSVCLLLSGCQLSSTAVATPDAGLAIQGRVQGGQQAIVGAHVYLFAANTTGYGGAGLAASASNASLSLLTAGAGRTLDSGGGATNNDYYVTSDSNGNFGITGDYSCTLGQQVYLYALGGNTGSGANSAAGLLAVLGNCPGGTSAFASGTPFAFMNEVSTIAAAYSFAGFATDATHVSSSGTALALTGIANAFANAANLATIGTGVALAANPAGNGVVPQSEINTLANILGSCINSSGAVTGPTNATACYTLLTSALSGGTTGSQPADTATAAINIAHNPAANIAALYALGSGTPPFAPALTSAPNDWTVGIKYTGGGMSNPENIAIDASGDAWVANALNPITEFSPTGAFLSGSSGFTGGGLSFPNGIALDLNGHVWAANTVGSSVTELNATNGAAVENYTVGGLNSPGYLAVDAAGNVWTPNQNGASVTELTNSGAAVTGSPWTGGGLSVPYSVAIDTSGNAWIGNNNGLTKFSSSGTPTAGSPYTTGGLSGNPASLAIDSSGNVWAANYSGNSVTEISSSGTLISTGSGYTGGGMSQPNGVSIDGANHVWIGNYLGNNVVELASNGGVLSGATGYLCSTCGTGLTSIEDVAVDGSGNLWVSFVHGNGVVEFVGIATPVVTPLVSGVKNNTLGTRP